MYTPTPSLVLIIRYSGLVPALRKERLIVDVMTFIARARDFMIIPSLSRLPYYHQTDTNLVLDFIVIHDHPVGSTEAADLFNATAVHSIVGHILHLILEWLITIKPGFGSSGSYRTDIFRSHEENRFISA